MMSTVPKPLISRYSAPLSGTVRVPGDKSISHRALILGASAVGQSRVRGLLEAEDVMCTAAALRALGIRIEIDGEAKQRTWIIDGRGVGGLSEAQATLDLGNSGTGARLLLGLLATQPITSVLTGDDSLRRGSPRPCCNSVPASRRVRVGCCRLPYRVRSIPFPLPMSCRSHLPKSNRRFYSPL